MRIFCHQRELRVVTGGYRWLWVVTGDSMFKVKPNVTDKHTNKHTPRWHCITMTAIIILDLIIISLWKSARSANRVQQQVPQVHSSQPLFEEILKNVSGLQKNSEGRWEHICIGKISFRTFMLVGDGIVLGAERKSLKDDETCETMLRCWQSIKCKIPDAQS